jgi:hypothetical protein
MTPAQVNGAGFCAGVECTHDAGGGNSRVECDTLRVKVYYEVPASGDFSEF